MAATPIYCDDQTWNDHFHLRRADIWARMTALRRELETTGLAEFTPLNRQESDRGTLLGVTFYEHGVIRRKRVADIIILNDRGDPNYDTSLPPKLGRDTLHTDQYFRGWSLSLTGFSVEVFRRRHGPVSVFNTGFGNDYEANADAAVQAFTAVARRLLPLAKSYSLSTDFPPEYIGESVADVLNMSIKKLFAQ